MAKFIRLMYDCLGLNNAVSLTKAKFDYKTGQCELIEGCNVDILDDGSIRRRKGTTATVITQASHSLYSGYNGAFFVTGALLMRLYQDFTTTQVATGLSLGAGMSFCDVQDCTYYMNGFQKGYIRNDTNYSWVAASIEGSPYDYRTFSDPPVGTLILVYNGRMYVVKGNVIYFSDRFAYHWFNLASDYLWYNKPITAAGAVFDGLFISTTEQVIFNGGNTPKEFMYSVVSDYPIIPGTLVTVKGEDVTGFEGQGKVLLWTSGNGIYAATSSGIVKNLTEGRLNIPSAVSRGSAVFRKGKYIVLLS